jgi:hypothetical protein
VSDLHAHPTAAELLDAALAYLTGTVQPLVPPEEAYGFRVALAALAIVGRELRSGPADEAAHLERLAALGFAGDAGLAAALRAGDVPAGALPAVRAALVADAEARLRVTDPRLAPPPPG